MPVRLYFFDMSVNRLCSLEDPGIALGLRAGSLGDWTVVIVVDIRLATVFFIFFSLFLPISHFFLQCSW